MPTNPMGILYEQNYNSQAENFREDFIPENLPTVQHVQINFGLKHRSLTCIVRSSCDQSSIWGKLDRLDTALHGKDIFKYGNQLFDNPLLLHF